MTATDQTPDPLKLARDALAVARATGCDTAYINVCSTAIAAIDALPAGVPAVTADDFFTLLGHAQALRMQGQTDMPAYFYGLAERIAPDAEHARKARALAAAMPASVPATDIDEEQLARLSERGAAAWAGVTDADVQALREGDAPASAPSGEPADTGWLQDRGLLYRLTDERRPANRDEIRVTMADGSRSDEACARRAGELLDRINATAPAAPAPAAVPAETRFSDWWQIHGARWRHVASRSVAWAAWQAGAAQEAPAPAAPPGMVLVPLRMTQAMRDVTDAGEWEWADLLAAANAVTPEEYEAAQAAPAPSPLPDDRAAFEAWARTNGLIGEGYGIRSENRQLPLVWMAWQAARTQAPAAPAPEPLRAAAQAVLDRWNSPRWEWTKQGPTADLIQALADALAGTSAPAVAAPEPRTLTGAQIERHGMPASECPPDSVVMLVSSIRRLSGMAAAPTTQEPE